MISEVFSWSDGLLAFTASPYFDSSALQTYESSALTQILEAYTFKLYSEAMCQLLQNNDGDCTAFVLVGPPS
jgi:hypothetical protein